MFLSIYSCKNTSYADFGMVSRYHLSESEHNYYPLTAKQVEEYQLCCEIEGPVYLNRAISDTTTNHKIFVGAGHEIHSSELIELIKNDDSLEILETKKFTGYATSCESFLIKKSGKFIIRTVYDEPNSEVTIMFDYLFESKNEAKLFFEDIEVTFSNKVKAR